MSNSSSWRNPYKGGAMDRSSSSAAMTVSAAGSVNNKSSTVRQDIADMNHRKILRRRTEERYIRELNDRNRNHELSATTADFGVDKLVDVRGEVDRDDAERAQRAAEVEEERIARQEAAARIGRNAYLPKSVKEPETLREIRDVQVGARHLVVTHGGATLWAGDANGDVRLCDGVSGETVQILPGNTNASAKTNAEEGGAAAAAAEETEQAENAIGAVTAMFATETHVWVGYQSGVVRVYDIAAFVHVTEGKFHEGAVSGFCVTGQPSGRTVSAGDDGCLIVWDTEAKQFDGMCKVVLPSEATADGESGGACGIASLTAVGPALVYCGLLNGKIVVVNVVSAEVEQVLAAHGDAVLGLASLSGASAVNSNDTTPYIFSVSADCVMKVWRRSTPDVWNHVGNATNIVEDACVAEHPVKSALLCVVSDEASRRVWTGEQDGTIRVWFGTADDGFTMERELPPLSAPVVRLTTAPAIDALKLWSLGSNGVNKMWYSCFNRSEQELSTTVQTLKAITTQDGVEIDKWREVVAKLQHIDARRKLQLARMLAHEVEERLTRRYLWHWRVFMMEHQRRRRRHIVAERLEAENDQIVRRRAFANWIEFSHGVQRNRIKNAFARLLKANTDKNATNLALVRLQTFVRIIKAAKKRKDLMLLLGHQSERVTMRAALRKWIKFGRARLLHNRKLKFVDAMMRACDESLTRAYYIKWSGVVKRRAQLAQRREIVELMFKQVSASHQRWAYLAWRRWALRKKTMARKVNVAETVLASTERGNMYVYYRLWMGLLRRCRLQKNEERKARAERNLNMIKQQYADLAATVEEKRRLDEQEAELQAEENALQQQEVKIKQLNDHIKDLNDEIDGATQDAQQMKESLAEQFATLIAQLKSRVINFQQDTALITSLRDKARNVPITKLFLEAHQQLKRVVVDVTGNPHLSGSTEPWPVTSEKLATIPSHQWSVVLPAIKTMIVAFDLMDRETRDGLESDREIVNNASVLMEMARLSQEHRRKTLGRGSASRTSRA